MGWFGTLLQILLRSLETGGIYALAALGIIIIFRTSNITHFAQGAMGMFNTYLAAVLVDLMDLPLGIGVVAAILMAVILGCLVDFVIIRRVKKVAPITKQILTLGLIMVFVGLAPMVFGVDPLSLPKFIPAGHIPVAGTKLSYNGLLNIALGIVIMLILFYVLQKTKMGIAIRTGHHCAQPTMERFGVNGMCRASFGLYNTTADIDALAKGVERAVKMLR